MVRKRKKKRYASQEKYNQLSNLIRRNPVAGYWAEFEPRRDVGVYANEKTTYMHNGEVKFT